MPDELFEVGGLVEIEYVAPLNRLQKAEDSIGILRTFESLAPLAQIDPTISDVVDPEQALRIMADVNGMPSKALRSPEAVKAMREGRQEQQQTQDLLQAAPVAASAAKDLAQAQSMSRSAPGPLPGIGL